MKPKKTLIALATVAGLLIAVPALIVGYFLLGAEPLIPRDAVEIQDARSRQLSSVQLMRELTEIPDFPNFSAQVYEWKNDSGEVEIKMKCTFDSELGEQQREAILAKVNEDYWSFDKDATIDFCRGWTTPDEMRCPKNIEPLTIVSLDWVSSNTFYVTYSRNEHPGTFNADSLKNYLGIDLPSCEIINRVNRHTTFRLSRPFNAEELAALAKNDWWTFKKEDDWGYVDQAKKGTNVSFDLYNDKMIIQVVE